MKKILFLSIVVLCTFTTYAQHTITLSIKNSEDKTPLAGATATIISLNRTTVADSLGIAKIGTEKQVLSSTTLLSLCT